MDTATTNIEENSTAITGSVLGPLEAPMRGTMIQEVKLNKIKLARNSRLDTTEDSIAGLMSSIKKEGLLQPIGLIKKGTGYEICFGNRRFLAVSKLGLKTIPAMVFKDGPPSDADMKNLTENIQRRNISLQEAGRYIKLLEAQGLTRDEIAVRLGVNKSYVMSCLTAYAEVPKEFQGDLAEVKRVNDRKKEPGKISISTAQKIINVTKSYNLTMKQKKELFTKAKKDPDFQRQAITQYAQALRAGREINEIDRLHSVNVTFVMKDSDYKDLYEKHVENGPFKTLNGYFVAILKGEKSGRVPVIK